MEKGFFSKEQKNQKIVINIHKEGRLRQNEIPKLDPLHMSFPESSSSCASTSKLCQPFENQARIKLRDYLFLTKTAANKIALEKRKKITTSKNKLTQTNQVDQSFRKKQSKSELRKKKYALSNGEMFDILKKEVMGDLVQGIQKIKKIAGNLDNQLINRKIPTNFEMVMMYNMRALVKNKLTSAINEIQLTLLSQCIPQETPIEIQILVEENELCGDMAFTQELFSKKYLEAQKQSQQL